MKTDKKRLAGVAVRIPKSTNGLESFFEHLKGNLNIHRGLTLQHRKNFITWYLYLRNGEAKFS